MKIPKQWLHIGMNFIDTKQIYPIKNEPLFPKPIGGLWASPFELGSEYYSDWQRFRDEVWGNEKKEKGVIFRFEKNARIYVIHTQQDLIQLIQKVGYGKSPLPFMTNVTIDFEKAKEVYDVIYLTKQGQIETRNPFVNREYNLYGWDCESALILNPEVIGNQMPVLLQ